MNFYISNLFGYGVFGGVVLQLFYPNAYATSNTVKYNNAHAPNTNIAIRYIKGNQTKESFIFSCWADLTIIL
jgi:hypothetical protein